MQHGHVGADPVGEQPPSSRGRRAPRQIRRNPRLSSRANSAPDRLLSLPLDGRDDHAERHRLGASTCRARRRCAWRTARTRCGTARADGRRCRSRGSPSPSRAAPTRVHRRDVRQRDAARVVPRSSSGARRRTATPGRSRISSCLSDASCIAVSSAAEYCARWPPSASSAPAWISASNTRLLHTRRSTRSQRSKKRRERAVFAARGEDRVDRARPTLRIAPSPKRIRFVADDGELVARLVHVGRQHLDAPISRASLMYFTTLSVSPMQRRQQRRHEVGGVVRLEPRRVVRDDRVRDRVRLVEAVAAERLDLARDLLDDARGRSRARPTSR